MLETDHATAELLAQQPSVELGRPAWSGDAEIVRRVLVEELDLPRLVKGCAVWREQDRDVQMERVGAAARGALEPRLALGKRQRLPADGAGEEIQDFAQPGKGTPRPCTATALLNDE
jgi:hypothetical protein